ncbi:MAG: hypothetical protein RMK84_19740 [Oscillochloridaceae bacterium]|nr:hypothetical protein [Chloroflexaceae bacterium]MDW8392356.1 hypothetical protein [Oscillochloridaceae bacterium]
MKLTGIDMSKIDVQLKKALRNAKPDDVFRVVMTLQPATALESGVPEFELDPTQFETREEYRRELIAARQRKMDAALHDTREELERLLPEVHGGKLSHTVVVEGPARQLISALQLSGVSHASLDQPLHLVEPRQSSPEKA